MNMKTMIKVMGLALALGPMAVLADDAVKVTPAPVAPASATPAPVDAEALRVKEGKKSPARPKLTEAQRAEMKARREKFMAERRAAMEAKMLEVVKKYVPEEEKAKALVKELQEAMKTGIRVPRNLDHRLPPPKPAAKPAAKPTEAPAAAPAK